MALSQVDEDDAFDLLREHSRTSGTKLRDIAVQFVATHPRPRPGLTVGPAPWADAVVTRA